MRHSVRMAIRRIMPYHESPDFEATRAFYTRVLGLEEGNFGGGYIGFGSGPAQVVFAPPGVEPVLPNMGVDVPREKPSMRRMPTQSGPGTRSSTVRLTSRGAYVASSFATRTAS